MPAAHRTGPFTRVLTSRLVYYAVLTPVGLVCRAVADPLHRRRRPGAATYFVRSPHTSDDL